jgi:hypothetical protein
VPQTATAIEVCQAYTLRSLGDWLTRVAYTRGRGVPAELEPMLRPCRES